MMFKQFYPVCSSKSFNFQLPRVSTVKKIDVSVIVEKSYMACEMIKKLFVVCDGQEDAIFLDMGQIWINYLTCGLMQKFLRVSIFLDSFRIMLLSICVMVKFQMTRAKV